MNLHLEDLEFPEAPALLLPQDENLISDSSPQFEWHVPSDANVDDFLHFRISIIPQDGEPFVFESSKNPNFFKPLPPVPQGQGSMQFVYPAWLGDGTYSWFVEAWDGLLWSEPSSEWQFTLDNIMIKISMLMLFEAPFCKRYCNMIKIASIYIPFVIF